MKASLPNGDLALIPNCDIVIPVGGNVTYTIPMRILPEISDAKSASYADANIIGRTAPIKTYSHSENRSITMKLHFVILKAQDAIDNLKHLRALQSAVYPRESIINPYLPPPVCRIRCGYLLSGSKSGGYLCAVLKQYSVDFPTDVSWYQSPDNVAIYLPYKFDVGLTWDIIYPSESLPGQDKIFGDT